MPKPGRLYAAITNCRLLPTFEPVAADRLPRFLRSVAAPVMPYMTFNTVVRSRAILTGPDTYTMINIHASEEAMRETIAGATDGRPEIEAILRNITILDRQSGPVEDIYHHAPLSSLHLLESNPEADPNLPFVVLTQYRIRPE